VAPDALLYVTQVAPYRDGPAGAHGVLDQSAAAVEELAGMVGLGFERVTDVRRLSDTDLSSAAVVALFTIGETPWSDHQRTMLMDQVGSGTSSVLAVHSATDACHGWAEYGRLVGARFAGHPWTTTVTLDVRRPDHPAVAHLGPTWTWHDEVYLFAGLLPDADVLLTARPDELGPTETAGGGTPATAQGGYPLAWCFTEGAGRVLSTSLGHFPHAWEDTGYLTHLLGGLRWLRGLDGT
jgi:type 1 glutamine amidotransferase